MLRSTDPICLLFGKTREAVLRLLFTHHDDRFFLRELSRRLSISPGALQRELTLLHAAGLIIRDRHGFFSSNAASPLFKPLRDILLLATATCEPLRRALTTFQPRIRCAVVFGSFARGEAGAESDVDLLIISNAEITMPQLTIQLAPAQKLLEREVSAFILTSLEFQKRVSSGNPFLLRILAERKLFLIGDQDELDRLAKERVASVSPDKPTGDRRPARHRRSRSKGLPDTRIG